MTLTTVSTTVLYCDKANRNGESTEPCRTPKLLSKAFDKVNQHAMFIKLMKRRVPVHLLELLENLFSVCYSFVKLYNVWSSSFDINFGVRQGSVLSPFLFALYLDDLSKLGLHLKVVV